MTDPEDLGRVAYDKFRVSFPRVLHRQWHELPDIVQSAWTAAALAVIAANTQTTDTKEGQ